MIDVRLLRTDLDAVRTAQARRGKPDVLAQIDAAVALDTKLRDLTAERDALRARVNDLSKQVGGLRKAGKNDEAEAVMNESRALGETERQLQVDFDGLQAQLRDVMLRIPNIPHVDAPNGASDADNPVIKGPVNMPAAFGAHQRVPHWETATALGILDNERATK
ncbi:MAG: serine--tRNA ligase, partial [Actinomycetota bacterium]